MALVVVGWRVEGGASAGGAQCGLLVALRGVGSIGIKGV